MDNRFSDIISLIQQARNNAIRAVNIELIHLYWNIGAYIKQKLSAAEWGDKTVDELALFIQHNNPEMKGFNRSGLYRMIQFYETYVDSKFVATTWQQLQSTENKETKLIATTGRQLQPQAQDFKKTIFGTVKLVAPPHNFFTLQNRGRTRILLAFEHQRKL